MADRWAAANDALLRARGLERLPAEEAKALLALLHAGTLVEPDDAHALRALDLERLALSRALADGSLDAARADAAAVRLLALGHREPARARLAGSALVQGAWRAWVGDGPPDDAPPTVLDLGALRLAPAAADGRLGVRLGTRRTGSLSIRRLRIGGTSLDLEARWRPGATVLRAHRVHGPALVLEVEFPEGAAVTADEVPLDGARARLELRDRHEVVAYA